MNSCLPLAENVIPKNTPNPLIANTSSTLAAAMTSVGIPLSTPKPLSARDNILGTTTAGDTAARTNLQKHQHSTQTYTTKVA